VLPAASAALGKALQVSGRAGETFIGVVNNNYYNINYSYYHISSAMLLWEDASVARTEAPSVNPNHGGPR
jgi:hypothetical protein